MTIGATLTVAQAGARLWDAAVVGAGPAGATIAGLLARHGLAVLLVDRTTFPRTKVCGSCLNGRALAALAAAGLGDLPQRQGAIPLHHVRLAAGRFTAELPLPGGVALSRTALDAALVHAALDRGVHFLPATRAALAAEQNEVREIELQHADGCVLARARVVLAADGLGSGLMSRAGIAAAPATPGSRVGAGVVLPGENRFYQPGIVYMATGAEGYAGVVRLEDGRLDLACAFDVEAVRAAGSPGPVAAHLLAHAGWPVPADLKRAAWRGTQALTRQAERVASRRLFALGDATGYIEPFTGEGIAWALASAVALAPVVEQAVPTWHPGLAGTWIYQHTQIVRRSQRACRLAAAILRRPRLTTGVVALLTLVPALAVWVLRLINQPDRPIPVPQTYP